MTAKAQQDFPSLPFTVARSEFRPGLKLFSLLLANKVLQTLIFSKGFVQNPYSIKNKNIPNTTDEERLHIRSYQNLGMISNLKLESLTEFSGDLRFSYISQLCSFIHRQTSNSVDLWAKSLQVETLVTLLFLDILREIFIIIIFFNETGRCNKH